MDSLLACVCDRDPLSYRAGEPMTFFFRARGGDRIRWRLTGDDGRAESGGDLRPDGGLHGDRGAASISTRLSIPGFVRVEADLLNRDGAAIAHFAGGAGADVASIRADTPEPPDFDAFWARHKAALAAVPPAGATCAAINSGRPDVRLFELSIPCPGGRPCTALLSVPASGGPFPARVRTRGYQASWGEAARNSPPPEELRADALVLYLSAHGFAFNRSPDYYSELRAALASNGHDYAFDPAQNADPGTAYFGGMAWRLLRGLEYLKTRPEWDGRSLAVIGGSMGGIQAVWAAALDHAVTECRPRIPWCCNTAGPAAGRTHGNWTLPWAPGLAYYDAVNMARRIPPSCRVVIPQAGLGDDISPPYGVMAFYNALRCPKEAVFIQGARHFVLPPEPWQTAVLASPKPS